MDNFKDEAGQPMGQSAINANQEATAAVRRSTVRVALRFAEQAADEINAKLRDAEIERDELARKLGAQQDMIDRLQSERDYRSRHVRDLMAVSEAGRPQS